MQKINNSKYSQVLLDATIFPLCEPTMGNTVCSRGLTKDYIVQDNCDNAQVGNTRCTRRHTKDYITQHNCNCTQVENIKSTTGHQPPLSKVQGSNLDNLYCVKPIV